MAASRDGAGGGGNEEGGAEEEEEEEEARAPARAGAGAANGEARTAESSRSARRSLLVDCDSCDSIRA
jgi:hypothetical protein